MIDSEDYLIISKKEAFSIQRIVLILRAMERPIVVYSEKREEFLSFFFRLWLENKNEYNMSGLRNLAEYLCALVDFHSADNDKTTINPPTIEKELFILKKNSR